MESLADKCMSSLQKISELKELATLENPLRHEINEIRLTATQILEDATNHVHRLANTAKFVSSTAQKEIDSSKNSDD